jgi:stress-induced morphogen
MNIEQMKARLVSAYPDAHPENDIQVFDLTGTSDHWEVAVCSTAFKGLSRIEQHQHVMKAFGPELKTGEVHALSIKTTIKSN